MPLPLKMSLDVSLGVSIAGAGVWGVMLSLHQRCKKRGSGTVWVVLDSR